MGWLEGKGLLDGPFVIHWKGLVVRSRDGQWRRMITVWPQHCTQFVSPGGAVVKLDKNFSKIFLKFQNLIKKHFFAEFFLCGWVMMGT